MTNQTTSTPRKRPSRDRRCRIITLGDGHYGFLYEKHQDGTWRLVESRGGGQTWDATEVLNRARAYAGLVGARVTVPIHLMQNTPSEPTLLGNPGEARP